MKVSKAELQLKDIDCIICGDEIPESMYDNDQHKCFVCWYNTNPGALASP